MVDELQQASVADPEIVDLCITSSTAAYHTAEQ